MVGRAEAEDYGIIFQDEPIEMHIHIFDHILAIVTVRFEQSAACVMFVYLGHAFVLGKYAFP